MAARAVAVRAAAKAAAATARAAAVAPRAAPRAAAVAPRSAPRVATAAAARAVAGLLQVALDVALVVGDALADRCVEELDKVAPLPLCVPLVAKLKLHQVARHLNREGGAQRSENLLLRRRPN